MGQTAGYLAHLSHIWKSDYFSKLHTRHSRRNTVPSDLSLSLNYFATDGQLVTHSASPPWHWAPDFSCC